jgi:hypothetical protein
MVLVGGHANSPTREVVLFSVDAAGKSANKLPFVSSSCVRKQISVYQDWGKLFSWNVSREGDPFVEIIDLDLPEDVDEIDLTNDPIFGGYRITSKSENHIIACGKNGRFEMEKLLLSDSVSTPTDMSKLDVNDFILNCKSDPYSDEAPINVHFDHESQIFYARLGDTRSKLRVTPNADIVDYIKLNEPILQLFVNDPRITVIRGIRRAHGMKGVVFFCYSKITSSWKVIAIDGGYSSMAMYGDYLVLKKEKYIDSSVDELRPDRGIIMGEIGHKGYQTIPTGEYEFYDLNLEFTLRLALHEDAEILAAREGTLYYKVSDELYRSDLDDPDHRELLCIGDSVKESHWLYFR